MRLISRMYKTHCLKRHMLREINEAITPREFIRQSKGKIEEVMGVRIKDERIDRLRIWTRIPGYDLYLYLRAKSNGFESSDELGRKIGRRTIYIAINRLVRKRIEKNKLYNFDPSDAKVSEQVDKIIKLVKEIAIHEFVHIVDHDREEEDKRRRQLGFVDSMKLTARVERGDIDEEMWDKTYQRIAELPFNELIAIGTTSLVLGKNVLDDCSDAYLGEYERVKERLRETQREDHESRFMRNYEFFMEERHLIATWFLAQVMPILGQETIREVLRRRPTFEELVNPELYC